MMCPHLASSSHRELRENPVTSKSNHQSFAGYLCLGLGLLVAALTILDGGGRVATPLCLALSMFGIALVANSQQRNFCEENRWLMRTIYFTLAIAVIEFVRAVWAGQIDPYAFVVVIPIAMLVMFPMLAHRDGARRAAHQED